MDLYYLYSILDRMDLNLPPGSLPLQDFWTLKIVIRKKVDCREVLVRKYGEEEYARILASEKPLMVPSFRSYEAGILYLFIIT